MILWQMLTYSVNKIGFIKRSPYAIDQNCVLVCISRTWKETHHNVKVITDIQDLSNHSRVQTFFSSIFVLRKTEQNFRVNCFWGQFEGKGIPGNTCGWNLNQIPVISFRCQIVKMNFELKAFEHWGSPPGQNRFSFFLFFLYFGVGVLMRSSVQASV